MKTKKSFGEHIFDSFNYLALTAFTLICAYPMIYVIFASFSEPAKLQKHSGILLAPQGWTTVGYKVVFENPNITSGYLNTITYVIVGTLLNILLTSMGAYVLSRKNLLFKSQLMMIIVFTMYFGGGLIPNFLLVKNLGLYDSRAALIIPSIIGTWNMIVMKTSFAAIPDSLEESAKMDGANDFIILFRIILPVAKATLAVMVLFYAVGHWNSWFSAMIYLRRRELFPLQLFLREVLIANSLTGNITTGIVEDENKPLIDIIIRYCTIVVATVPILFLYPFCQKYFMKGVMVGSVKG